MTAENAGWHAADLKQKCDELFGCLWKSSIFAPLKAGVAKLVDALDLGSSAVRRGGSSPFARTCEEGRLDEVAFLV